MICRNCKKIKFKKKYYKKCDMIFKFDNGEISLVNNKN